MDKDPYMPNNTVSVIIPTHNRQNGLIRAIDSARAQSWPPAQIIVVDDKSNFSVSSFLFDRYGNSIQVISNDRNLGPAGSRNIGARAAKGEYIAFLDSDDYWYPEKLEKQLAVFAANKDVGLVYCNQWYVSPDGLQSGFKDKLIDNQLWERLLDGWLMPNPSTLVFRRSVFMQLGGFDPQLRSSEDHDLWLRLAQAQIPVAYCPERLSYFSWDHCDRLSYNDEIRLNGTKIFLSKWKNQIIESRGQKHYNRFEANYINLVAYCLVKDAVIKRDLLRVLSIIRRYLIFNMPFYKRVCTGLLRRLSRYLRTKAS
jgi:glycosyltransferase involved in cell wall biosynthesis